MSQESKSRTATIATDASDETETYIPIKRRVSKIDRFALRFAIEAENNVTSRLTNILNMFLDRSSELVCEFTMKCKLGFQRHRQDRILNQSKNFTKKQQQTITTIPYTYLGNDRLFYGESAQLVHELLNQTLPIKEPPQHIKRKKTNHKPSEINSTDTLSELFEPSLYAQKLEQMIRDELRRSVLIISQLDLIQNTLRSLASNHRDQVDSVYSAVEQRQSSVVIRRSAYNLSLAATEATSTTITGWSTKAPSVH